MAAGLFFANSAGAAESPATRSLSVRGVLQPMHEVTLRSPVDTRVAGVHVEAGREVEADQVLVELDVSGLQRNSNRAGAGSKQAAAERALADSGVERLGEAEQRLRSDVDLARSLANRPPPSDTLPGRRGHEPSGNSIMRAPLRELAVERASTAESQTQDALLRVRMQRSVVESLHDELGEAEVQTRIAHRTAELLFDRYAAIAAPISGTVAECPVGPHERVSAGQPLVTVIDTRQMKALLWIPARWVGRVDEGSPVRIRPEGLGDRSFAGEISRIRPQPHPRTGQYLAEVVLDNADGRLLPGTFVDATLSLRHEK